jgi:hypothetical protein
MTEPFPTGRAGHAKCGTCGETRHLYLFPWADPDANAYASPARVDNPKAHAAFAKRVEEAAAKRRVAQAKGRDTSKCHLCTSAEGNE